MKVKVMFYFLTLFIFIFNLSSYGGIVASTPDGNGGYTPPVLPFTITPPPPPTTPLEQTLNAYTSDDSNAGYNYDPGTSGLDLGSGTIESDLNEGIHNTLEQYSDISNMPSNPDLNFNITAGAAPDTYTATLIDPVDGVINGYSADFSINAAGGVDFQNHEVVTPTTLEGMLPEAEGLNIGEEEKAIKGEKTVTINVDGETETVDSTSFHSTDSTDALYLLEITGEDYVYQGVTLPTEDNPVGILREVKKVDDTLLDWDREIIFGNDSKLHPNGEVIRSSITFNLGESDERTEEFDLSNEAYLLGEDGRIVFGDDGSPITKNVTNDGTVFDLETLAIEDSPAIGVSTVKNIASNLRENGVANYPRNLIVDNFDALLPFLHFSTDESPGNFDPSALGFGGIAGDNGIPAGLVSAENIVVTLDLTGTTLDEIAAGIAGNEGGSAEELLKRTAEIKSALEARFQGEYKYCFANNESNDLLFMHQPYYQLSYDEKGNPSSLVRSENYLWYDLSAGHKEYSLLNGDSGFAFQISDQRLLKLEGSTISQYYDVGDFSVEYYGKDESGSYVLNKTTTYQGLDYVDTDNDGVADIKKYDKKTETFANPIPDFLTTNEIYPNRYVATQETTNYTLNLKTGEFSEVVQEFDSNNNVLYQHSRVAFLDGGKIVSGDDETTYYVYDESGALVKETQVAGHYTYDPKNGKYSPYPVTVDGQPAQASYFISDNTGIQKLFAQNSSGGGGSGRSVGLSGSRDLAGGGKQGGKQDSADGETLPPGADVNAGISGELQDYWDSDKKDKMDFLEKNGYLSEEEAAKGRELSDSKIGTHHAQANSSARTTLLHGEGLNGEQTTHLLGILKDKDAAIEYLKNFYMDQDQGLSPEEALTKASAMYSTLINVAPTDLYSQYLEAATNMTDEEIEHLLGLEDDAEKIAYLTGLGLSEEEAEDHLNNVNRLKEEVSVELLEELGLVDMTTEEKAYFNSLNENHALFEYLVFNLGFDPFNAEVILGQKFFEDGSIEQISGYDQGYKLMQPIFDRIILESDNIGAGNVEQVQQAIIDGIFSGELTLDNAEEFINNLVESLPPPASEEVPQPVGPDSTQRASYSDIPGGVVNYVNNNPTSTTR